jgi:hypothetical protein
MMINRPNMAGGAPGGAPGAPGTQAPQSGGGGGGGGLPLGMQMQAPQVYMPRVPQLPYMQTPGINLPGGGSIRGPNLQGPQIPQLPQPTMPSGKLGGISNNTLLIIIVGLIALLIGVGIALLVMKK